MPRLAANLGLLFAERPFLERFGAAAAAGFRAVELLSPYEHAATAVRAELVRHGLTQLGINTPIGREGDSGLAALPGREREWQEAFARALDYAAEIGACFASPAACRRKSARRPRRCSSPTWRAPPRTRPRPASCC
jgi:2-dehydrotetronate isomerase